jgi:Cu-Zn family superoxide dismutase
MSLAHDRLSIIGRGVIVHAKADDLKSQPAGDSGDRIACGVIGRAKSEQEQ